MHGVINFECLYIMIWTLTFPIFNLHSFFMSPVLCVSFRFSIFYDLAELIFSKIKRRYKKSSQVSWLKFSLHERRHRVRVGKWWHLVKNTLGWETWKHADFQSLIIWTKYINNNTIWIAEVQRCLQISQKQWEN